MRRIGYKARLAAAVAAGAALGTAGAAELFTVTAAVGTDTGVANYTTVQQTFDGLSDAALSALLPGYTGAQPVSLAIEYRGLRLDSAYPLLSDPTLTLDIPSVGISETFVGNTREDSRRLMREYFKSGDALGRIFKALAELSPVDPLAGNPASLQSQMVAGSYARHFVGLVSAITSAQPSGAATAGLPARGLMLASAQGGLPAPDSGASGVAPSFSVEVDAARYRSAGLASTVVALPLRFTPDVGPDRPWSIDAELHHTDTEGASTVGGQLGVAYRWRAGEAWYLVPAITGGLVGSKDLGNVGTMVSASLTSAFRLHQTADFSLWMGNALNATRSLRTEVQGYEADPGLSNRALTNGLLLAYSPSAWFGRQSVELMVADTRYFGSELYDSRYDEIGVALVRAMPGPGGPTTLRAELRWLDTTNSRGWGLRVQVGF